MDRARLLEKIQKCMNLSKSSEPHEAAAALRQAAKLMEKHGVSDEELGVSGLGHETIHTSIQVNRKVVPAKLNAMVILMERAFGVKGTMFGSLRKSDYNYSVTYYGKKDRVVLAAYSHTVCAKALDGAWTVYLQGNPAARGIRGARASFELAWVAAIIRQVQDVAGPEEKEELTQFVNKSVGHEVESSKIAEQTLYQDVMDDGRRAAADFSLRTPLN